MKIIICGGGITGLSTYLYLRKHLPGTNRVTLYESHRPRIDNVEGPLTSPYPHQAILNLDRLSASTALVGGRLGISPNGMRVLRDLSGDLHDRVIAQGFPAEKFVFKGANGWTLGVQSTSDKAVRAQNDHAEVCIASSRHGLWQTILRYAQETYGGGVVRYRKVVTVERMQSGGIEVRSIDENGNEEADEADLVIGADGVKSVVRKALFGDEPRCQPSYTLRINRELPHWANKGLVLIGDAAHAMDPTTGQGASQALEDSQTLALLLGELFKDSRDVGPVAATVEIAIEQLHQIRAPRIHAIVQRGKKLAGRKVNIGVIAEYFMYFFLWLLNRSPTLGNHALTQFPRCYTNFVKGKIVLGDVNQELYTWSAADEVKKAQAPGVAKICARST
ncbi:FAD/NAD(P)-binding domain-containing protein [Setomelanomma holmii]|uniref:FAD/NAD(P)-binding domain-containing protein n=1 Tax=Setomelanomma holmii TaxID=210430 RepID=A0A9P4H1F9_9PLEO|nr:FAD/NAD(P)-binding domain-containing protein [Setomelanomma holmii]